MPAPDRTLKRMVARLARARGEDIEAVLSGLSSGHRLAVEGLLASYRGEPAATPLRETAAPADASIAVEGLSPWLLARLERAAQSGANCPGAFGELVGAEARAAGLAYGMTTAAFETLRACAAGLEPTPRAASGAKSALRRRLIRGAVR